MRILLVEDDPLIVEVVRDLILDTSHEIVGFAGSKDAALQLAAETHPDIAVMDFRLADGQTGGATAFELRKRYGVPSLFVTGSPGLTREDLMKAEALGWVEKPYEIEAFVRALATAEAKIRGEIPNVLPPTLQPY